MPDTLRIHDLAVQCRLGVPEWERQAPQPVWIDLELAIDAAKAAKRDDVGEAVDYAALVRAVKALAESRSFRLMESLAEAVASLMLQKFGAPRVRVRVKKRALPEIESAEVEIDRSAVGSPRRSVRSPKAARR